MKYLILLPLLTFFSFHLSAQSMTSANAFADSLESELELGKTELINSRFSVKDVLKKVLFEDKGNKQLEDFNRMFSEGFKSKFDYGKIIVNQLNGETYYNFIESYVNQETKKVHIVFRLFSIANGLNYHDYELHFDESKSQWEIKDVYVYLSGENITKTFKSIYIPMILPLLNNEKANTTKELASVQKINLIRQQYKEGNFEEAYDKCNSVAESYQSKKYFRIIALQIAEKIGEEAYLKEAEKILALFPNDKHTTLISVDYHYMRKEYNKVLETINKLDEMVGKDDLLDFHRANTYYEMGDTEKASVLYENVVNSYPYFQEAYDVLVEIRVVREEYEAAVNVIDVMQYNMEYDKDELIKNIKKIYPKLVKSREFKSWAKK